MDNNKNPPPDSSKTHLDRVMEEIDHNYNGITSNQQLIDRTILSVTPIVITLTLIIDTTNINTTLIRVIIYLFVAAFLITAGSSLISTIKLHRDNTRYQKQIEKHGITSNKDNYYWIVLISTYASLVIFATAILLITLSPNHQHEREITMSSKKSKDRPQAPPQDPPTEKKIIPSDDEIIRGGVIPRPVFVEPDPTDSEPEGTPDNPPPDNPPPEEPEKE